MYAVIESGGKQHRVEEGEVLKLEKLDASTGESINFDKVLMIGEGAGIKLSRATADVMYPQLTLAEGAGVEVSQTTTDLMYCS